MVYENREGSSLPFTMYIVPIVKDNIGDITSSDNYRTIAIGSPYSKVVRLVNHYPIRGKPEY